jgi:hypothetical protein
MQHTVIPDLIRNPVFREPDKMDAGSSGFAIATPWLESGMTPASPACPCTTKKIKTKILT